MRRFFFFGSSTADSGDGNGTPGDDSKSNNKKTLEKCEGNDSSGSNGTRMSRSRCRRGKLNKEEPSNPKKQLRRSMSFSFPARNSCLDERTFSFSGDVPHYLYDESDAPPHARDVDCYMWSPEGNLVFREYAIKVPKAQSAMENDSPGSRCCSCSTGHSPVSSPIALRCRSTRLSNLFNKNEVLDQYIDGGQQDTILNEKQQQYSTTSMVPTLGRPPRPQSIVPSMRKSMKDILGTYPNVDLKDACLQQLTQEDAAGDTCNVATKEHASVSDAFERIPHLEDHRSESMTSVEDIYEDLQHMRPPNIICPSTCPTSGTVSRCSIADPCFRDAPNFFHDDDLDFAPEEQETDDKLLQRAKEVESRFIVPSGDEYELNMFRDKRLSSNDMLQLIQLLTEDRKQLAHELSSQIRARVTERFASKEQYRQSKKELDTSTRRLEKEKSEVQTTLEREMDRRSQDWSARPDARFDSIEQSRENPISLNPFHPSIRSNSAPRPRARPTDPNLSSLFSSDLRIAGPPTSTSAAAMEETPPGPGPRPQPAHASPPFPPAPFTPPPRVFSPVPLARGTPSPGAAGPGSGPGLVPAHLSTPPGPPVFSSQLRRAAVPFRATPASPHPVPFAAGYSSSSSAIGTATTVSLPTSSVPHFINGAATPHGDLVPPAPSVLQGDGLDNPYVQFSAHKVLKQKKLLNAPSLGFGALVSPGKEVSRGPEVVERDPRRCLNCGAYVNLYCDILIASGQWQCVICKKLNGSEGEFVVSSKQDLLQWPELASTTVDYVQLGNRRPGFVPVSDTRVSGPIFILIDECLDEAHLQHLQGSLHAFVDSLPPTAKIGIITYGRTVSVYDFSEGAAVSADVLPGNKSPTHESLKALIYGTGVYLSPVHASLPVAHIIFSSLRPYQLSVPEVSRDRCLGAAVEVALGIIQGPSVELSRGIIKRSGGNCRILVCAGGPSTFGPGSVPYSVQHPNYAYLEKAAMKWMESLGHEAQRHSTIVDILCAGTCPVRVPVLQPLAKCSGGVLLLHDDFGEAFGVNLQRASTRAAGSHGLFEIRCSDNMLVTQVIGPGEEASPDSHETFKHDTSFCIQMHSVEEMQSFSVSMETKGDIKNDFVFFQFAVRYSNMYQAEVTRVITMRLQTVDGLSAYLASVQEDVASVIVGKRTVLRARTASDAIDMRISIDERVKDIALKFGSQAPKSKLYRFPKELASLPECLFHLKRGPLLGSIIGHEDERSVLRNLFLNASFDLSLRMLAPRCIMHREGGTFEELPAYDLAMQSSAAVVLDHGTDIFIWLGAELAAQEGQSAAALAACRTLAEELSEQRFPAPRILSFKQGSSQARYFVSRLIPAHKDPTYEQESRFPQLRTLTPEQRARLKSSFIHFDDHSFCEWMRSLKLVPPEPS